MKKFNNDDEFNKHAFEDVEIYIHKELILDDEAFIYQKARLPFAGIIFGSKGIHIVNMN